MKCRYYRFTVLSLAPSQGQFPISGTTENTTKHI